MKKPPDVERRSERAKRSCSPVPQAALPIDISQTYAECWGNTGPRGFERIDLNNAVAWAPNLLERSGDGAYIYGSHN